MLTRILKVGRTSIRVRGAFPIRSIWTLQPLLNSNSSPLGVDRSVESNVKSETNRLAKGGKKFWENVTLSVTPNREIQLELDSKPIKTPLGNKLAFNESKKLLALLLQKEWEAVSESTVKQHALPLTSLVSRCIDLEITNGPNSDVELRTKIGGDRSSINKDLLRYLDTDTLLVFSPRDEYEGDLRAAQDELYLPIIKSMEEFLTDNYADAHKTVSLRILDADIHGLRGNAQDPATKAAATTYLDSLSLWNLAVFEKTVLSTKSFICGILLLQNKAKHNNVNNLKYSVDDIVRASTLETIYQTERWGEVEDTHDVSKRNIKRNVNAASIVAFNK
ncbi:similar to Saccharomyces cerevisiae YJL180C ATP12 Conserved protein required for assembly of alpha and beta subunits into the F1 sector of mitochondrial F1F0 ATP synthase [Maudiozyma barnettii]|uniref:Similar to Saccharomyces cerevisiae YJL180C ATP12 Conserved protein required for assembly of alpha and beta subunits into the F1 sector of mitochondrial F1F0 ATP synthase n=1 Tax=Maudiozyma barnettii TaxID=61262 RepID=A0A8H2ZHF4_9SACH|nr:ATP synthase complex assembly protein ATP12 [Kazachstania barnettii]CAB4254708.1 similar to Saccharomyces cerevisiae YJL180C ATP12 Conserved protein required for assembly of alpha and beta subunits into the F1 sector of mitochondrial F1F0 ATP synthase [Kazachstania barnettii]CAD1782750.1 similar to Saccharomyces cerevisiae YJL180C ATP12 Conserved protein required for assembly of alpha and beta subunits into the F1 sector of mitochondrial F1F0 ATP synthase [Kazachstania barnettii]